MSRAHLRGALADALHGDRERLLAMMERELRRSYGRELIACFEVEQVHNVVCVGGITVKPRSLVSIRQVDSRGRRRKTRTRR